ncbi:MAG: helix-turn-helix domain-containing protein [Candidatus Heteroscillospira sp.]|jgi:transcriptional regulator with XRE-family HTH domain
MTIGERLGALRKEKGLSQEALGEALGVSRQAISKWEADASLPEIDKLVSLSRLFGVSVGELLGVEEPERQEAGELTEEQLRMAKEIAGKYIEAFPPPPPAAPKKLPRWVKISAACAVLALGLLLYQVLSLQDAVDILRRDNSELQNRVTNISIGLDRATGNLTERVEEILKKQNNLVADYGAKVIWCDYASGKTTVELYAIPRSCAPDTTARFSAGEQNAEGGRDGERFAARLDVNIYEEQPPFYVSFESGGVRQTQHLEDVYLSDLVDYPALGVDSNGFSTFHEFWGESAAEAREVELFYAAYGVSGQLEAGENHGSLRAVGCGFGLFLNGEPIYFSPVYPPEWTDRETATEQELDGEFLKISVPAMEPGDCLSFAEGAADEYGRLHMSTLWELNVDENRMLDPEGTPEAPSHEFSADGPMAQALLAHLLKK